MKVSLDWLREYVDVSLSPEELAARLTQSGLNVEGVTRFGNDHVFELETFSNRPDHLGHIGIAREISWILGVPLRLPKSFANPAAGAPPAPATDWTSVTIEDQARCPRYLARGAIEVKIAASPDWLRRRLEAIGVRPVNNVVDLSNYVLFEQGQPLHAFDYDRLLGHRIVVRRARRGEELPAINGRTYRLDPEDLVIADAERPVALAGIMGGAGSEVSSSTRKILLESAWFEPVAIRRSARRHQLRSDASHRFERRVDPEGLEPASVRFMQLLQEIAGASLVAGSWECCARDLLPPTQRRIRLRPARIGKVLGITIPEGEIQSTLEALGFTVLLKETAAYTVETPSYRSDVEREVDLIEELARVHGYDAIPEAELTTLPVRDSRTRERVEGLKTWLTGAGYREALTFSFVEGEEFAQLESLWVSGDPLEVRNPVRAPERFLRRSLLPNLLKCIRSNRNGGVEAVRLFEVARVFHMHPAEERPREEIHLAWAASGVESTLRDGKGVAEGVLRLLRAPELDWLPAPVALGFSDGQGCVAQVGARTRGIVGALAIEGIPGVVWAGELTITPLLEAAVERLVYREFPRFPGIRRDLNVVVAEPVPWGEIHAAILKLKLRDLVNCRFTDLYAGKQVGAGKKSVTFALHFQSRERTLRHEEAEEQVQAVLSALGKQFDAELRVK